jgi:hypothetical protein
LRQYVPSRLDPTVVVGPRRGQGKFFPAVPVGEDIQIDRKMREALKFLQSNGGNDFTDAVYLELPLVTLVYVPGETAVLAMDAIMDALNALEGV